MREESPQEVQYLRATPVTAATRAQPDFPLHASLCAPRLRPVRPSAHRKAHSPRILDQDAEPHWLGCREHVAGWLFTGHRKGPMTPACATVYPVSTMRRIGSTPFAFPDFRGATRRLVLANLTPTSLWRWLC